jgi:hypothetical protein
MGTSHSQGSKPQCQTKPAKMQAATTLGLASAIIFIVIFLKPRTKSFSKKSSGQNTGVKSDGK